MRLHHTVAMLIDSLVQDCQGQFNTGFNRKRAMKIWCKSLWNWLLLLCSNASEWPMETTFMDSQIRYWRNILHLSSRWLSEPWDAIWFCIQSKHHLLPWCLKHPTWNQESRRQLVDLEELYSLKKLLTLLYLWVLSTMSACHR